MLPNKPWFLKSLISPEIFYCTLSRPALMEHCNPSGHNQHFDDESMLISQCFFDTRCSAVDKSTMFPWKCFNVDSTSKNKYQKILGNFKAVTTLKFQCECYAQIQCKNCPLDTYEYVGPI